MEAPKCKLCNERHYGVCQLPVADRPVVKAINRIKPTERFAVAVDTSGSLKQGYNSYMREYMRGWRKRQKEKG